MSRAIAESLSLLSETLNNCKTNLTEKQVADVDNIKISDVDEKIAEIQAGGKKYNVSVDSLRNYYSDGPCGFDILKVSFNNDDTHNIYVKLDNQYKNKVTTLYAVNNSKSIQVQGVKGDNYDFTFSNITNQMDRVGVVAISERQSYAMPEPDSQPPFITYSIIEEK